MSCHPFRRFDQRHSVNSIESKLRIWNEPNLGKASIPAQQFQSCNEELASPSKRLCCRTCVRISPSQVKDYCEGDEHRTDGSDAVHPNEVEGCDLGIGRSTEEVEMSGINDENSSSRTHLSALFGEYWLEIDLPTSQWCGTMCRLRSVDSSSPFNIPLSQEPCCIGAPRKAYHVTSVRFLESKICSVQCESSTIVFGHQNW